MKWSITQLRKFQDKPFEFHQTVNFDHLVKSLDLIDLSDIDVEGELTVRSSEVIADMHLTGTYTMSCARTLVPVEVPIDIKSQEIFDLEGYEQFENDEDEDEHYHDATDGMINLKDIAEEKSGVIKSNKPVVLGNVPQNVLEILLNKAQSENSKSFLLGRDFQIKIIPDVIEYQDSKNLYNFALRPLVEAYDIGVAVQAIQLLQLDLDRKKIEEAINETRIPGRYDVIQTSPEIIVDGAHNLQAMENLLNLVRKKKKGQIYVLLGMMKDKDLGPVTKLFKDEKVTLTRIDYPRAARLEDFPKEAQKEFEYKENFEEAYTSLKNKLQADDMLLVTGSFYLVGAVLNYCKRGKDES